MLHYQYLLFSVYNHRDLVDVLHQLELPPFTGRNVPIKEIANAIGKDTHYIRLAIQAGVLKFGVAMKMENSNEYSYYCPDRKVWEETGYFRNVAKEKALAQ